MNSASGANIKALHILISALRFEKLRSATSFSSSYILLDAGRVTFLWNTIKTASRSAEQAVMMCRRNEMDKIKSLVYVVITRAMENLKSIG